MNLQAIVVLYNPDHLLILRNIAEISSAVNKCFVIVNACNNEILDNISQINNVEIIKNTSNIGLSKSLNLGIKSAVRENAEAVVLFDQDSFPSKKFFETIRECYQKLKLKGEKIGAIGARPQDLKDIKYYDNFDNKVSYIETDFVITSGCMIPIDALKNVGLMDETFFIDYIDYEWCFRALSNNYKIFVSTKSFLNHNLGDQLVGFLSIKKPIHHNVMRHFHIIRNQLIMLCRNYTPIKWRFVQFFKLFYRIPGYIYYSSDRKKTIGNIFRAFVDFYKLKNKTKYFY